MLHQWLQPYGFPWAGLTILCPWDDSPLLTADLGSGNHQTCRVVLLSLSRMHFVKQTGSRALKRSSCGLQQVGCKIKI